MNNLEEKDNLTYLIEEKKYKEALYKVEHLLIENEDNDLLEMCGDIYKETGEYDLSMEMYSKAYKTDKNNLNLKAKLLEAIHCKEKKDEEYKNNKNKPVNKNPFSKMFEKINKESIQTELNKPVGEVFSKKKILSR